MKGFFELAMAMQGFQKDLGHVLSMVERVLAESKKYAQQQRSTRNTVIDIPAADVNRPGGATLNIHHALGGVPALTLSLVGAGGATDLQWSINGEHPWVVLNGDSIDNETIGTVRIVSPAGTATGKVLLRVTAGAC